MDKICQNYDSDDSDDEYDESNCDSDDDTISQLNNNDLLISNSSSKKKNIDYEHIIEYVQTEEQKVINDLRRNEQLIPEGVKKGRCDLKQDQTSYNYFTNTNEQTNRSHLIFYLKQRKTSEQSINTSLVHCSQFIYYVKKNNPVLKTMTDTQQLLTIISSTYPTLPHNYFDYLYDQNNLQPSTIMARIDSLAVLFEWLLINSNSTNIYSDMGKRLALDRKRFKIMDQRSRNSKTLDTLIRNRQWVDTGMTGLLEMMKNSFPYFDSLVCLSLHQNISCHQYSWALGYALASLWVLTINARIKCIESLTMGEYQNIKKNKFHLSTQFKSSQYHSYQIIDTTDIVDVFIKYIRIQIIPPQVDSEESVVFPSFKKIPLCKGEASKKISNIFKQYGYDLNVTTLRSMISTHIEEQYNQHLITDEEYQIFIRSGQTHSIATHNKFYVKKKRKYDDGIVIQNIHENHFPQDSSLSMIDDYYGDIITTPSIDPTIVYESNSTESPSSFPSSSFSSSITTSLSLSNTTSQRPFGSARSDVNQNKKRYDWINEEINYLKHYIQVIEPTLSQIQLKYRYSTCLLYIKQSAPDNEIQYFHSYHLENSDRLKTGFLRALELINQSINESIN